MDSTIGLAAPGLPATRSTTLGIRSEIAAIASTR